MKETILIVDDDRQLAHDLASFLRQEEYQVFEAHTAAEGRKEVSERYPDLVLMDLHLPDGIGSQVMEDIKADHPDTDLPFIIVTADASIHSAVESTRRGANDYLSKPFDPDELLVSIQNTLQQRAQKEEIRLLRKRDADPWSDTEPSFISNSMRKTMASAHRAASGDGIVLMLGESGTGKDHWARWIHRNSRRASGPFFSINCAALSREIAESELFGHEPGAFTGAAGRKHGLVELANEGTLMLNEVGELELSLQSKLLTFLDSKSFVRVGGDRNITIDTRIIAATNRNLEEEVEKKNFRLDLYYRLNVFNVTLPPLRERIEDIPLITNQVLQKLAQDLGLSTSPTIGKEALNKLKNYHWPGNIRELQNVLERALIVAQGPEIHASHLSLQKPNSESWQVVVPFPSDRNLHQLTRDVARAVVEEALRRGKTKQEAASLLGISRHALAHQIKVLGINS